MLAEPTPVPEAFPDVAAELAGGAFCTSEDLDVELAGLSSSLRKQLDKLARQHHKYVTELVAQARPQGDRLQVDKDLPENLSSEHPPSFSKYLEEERLAENGGAKQACRHILDQAAQRLSDKAMDGQSWISADGSLTAEVEAPQTVYNEAADDDANRVPTTLPADFDTYSEEERKKELNSRVRTSRKSLMNNQRPSDRLKEAIIGTISPEHGYKSAYFEAIVANRKFEIFFCALIMFNAIFFGIEAEVNARTGSEESHWGFKAISVAFTMMFSIEIGLRFLASGPRAFFQPPDHVWNVFDLTIVVLSLLEVMLFIVQRFRGVTLENSQNLLYVRMIRIVRTARIFRVIRIFNFFRSLRLLLFSVLNTLRSLLWTMVLLLIILYTFGVIFTQAATQLLIADGKDDPDLEELDRYYGSVGRSVYTLFMSITNGVDWQNAVAPLQSLHWLFVGFFVVYIAFTYFAVLNVVTGVFCQTAIESAAKDQEEVMQVQRACKEDYVRQLTELFCDKDQDGSGELTIDEFEELLQDERLQKYCASLDITIDDAWALFKLLDTDGSGAIEVNEFVTGCLRLKGSARSVDIALLMYQVQWMIERFTKFISYTDGQFQGLRQANESQAASQAADLADAPPSPKYRDGRCSPSIPGQARKSRGCGIDMLGGNLKKDKKDKDKDESAASSFVTPAHTPARSSDDDRPSKGEGGEQQPAEWNPDEWNTRI